MSQLSVGSALLASLLALTGRALPSQAPASQPSSAVLWRGVPNPSPDVLRFEQAERGRGSAWTSSTFIAPDMAALTALPEAGGAVELGFELPGQGVRIATFTRFERCLGHQVFVGTMSTEDSATPDTDGAMLCVGPSGAVAGDFQLGANRWSLHATGLGNVHVLRGIDRSHGPHCGVTHAHDVHAAPGQSGRTPHALRSAGGGGSGTASSTTDTTIDVLIAYTPNARLTAGGAGALEADLVIKVARATQCCQLSGVPVRFRLVHTAETNYVEDGSDNDLARFRSRNDGAMDEVHGLRDIYGADLMHLITQPPQPLRYCGVAYLMRFNSTTFESSAFGVTVRSCLALDTMTHEFGHNLSCNHDRANAGSGLFDYGYGYRTPDNLVRTMMAYPPGIDVNRWSSPNVVVNGQTLGVAASEDNALAVTMVRDTAALFRPTTVYDWQPIDVGIGGVFGEPRLVGRGSPLGGGSVELVISRGAPNAPGALIFGASRIDRGLLGATLVPAPDLALPITGTLGSITIDVSVLRTLPAGQDFFVQTFFADRSAPQGLAASDALQTTTL